MKTLKQHLQEISYIDDSYYHTRVIKIENISKAVKEWLQEPEIKQIFYKNLMPGLSGETQKAIEKSFKELIEEVEQ